MQRSFRLLWSTSLLLATGMVAQAADAPYWQSKDSKDQELYVDAPKPPGVKVIYSELDGPVYATADGKAMYSWPLRGLRNGNVGDRQNSGEVTCGDTVFKETSGYMSPYPPGFLLPELESRKSCDQLWPAVLAPADAKPVGKWTIVTRKDGQKQWAFDGYPVYTSDRDTKPGDVLGGSKVGTGGESGALREPIGPNPDLPPEFAVAPFRTGRMLTNHKGFAVYSSDADAPGKSNCTGKCLETWNPVLAPVTAKPSREWSVVERSPGIRQWAFRGQPLYTYVEEKRTRSIIGGDIPGWHNVFTQRSLMPPAEFTVQDARIGQVLADANGKTIYYYSCNDDAMDQQTCAFPDSPQVYRLMICGNGDPKLCNETWPYVKAKAGARADSALWTVMTIDQNTGKKAEPNTPGAVQVWAYRDRPVYTFARDKKPGDAEGDSWGEFNGARNGFKAYWLRDDYRNNVFGR